MGQQHPGGGILGAINLAEQAEVWRSISGHQHCALGDGAPPQHPSQGGTRSSRRTPLRSNGQLAADGRPRTRGFANMKQGKIVGRAVFWFLETRAFSGSKLHRAPGFTTALPLRGSSPANAMLFRDSAIRVAQEGPSPIGARRPGPPARRPSFGGNFQVEPEPRSCKNLLRKVIFTPDFPLHHPPLSRPSPSRSHQRADSSLVDVALHPSPLLRSLPSLLDPRLNWVR